MSTAFVSDQRDFDSVRQRDFLTCSTPVLSPLGERPAEPAMVYELLCPTSPDWEPCTSQQSLQRDEVLLDRCQVLRHEFRLAVVQVLLVQRDRSGEL